MDRRQTLPKDTVLADAYRIRKVIGSGGFGITYEAEDIRLSTAVAIKEYFPDEFGERDAGMSVRPRSERHKQTFQWGRTSFLEEARTLARFQHASIVHILRIFEANSTAYMVMRLERGESFENWLRGLGRLPTQAELDRITAPLLDALEIMHASNFLHRDIAPDNIIVRPDGTPVLLDFGAARSVVAKQSRALTGIVKAGYSPHEQYSTDARLQGPWSDLYALGGTLYRAVVGRAPDEATLRISDDGMRRASQDIDKGRYRPSFLKAIDACLVTRPSDRPQSVAALRPGLLGRDLPAKAKPSVPRARNKPVSAPPNKPASMPKAQPKTYQAWPWLVAAAIATIVAGSYGGTQYARWAVYKAETETKGAKRVAEAVAEKKKAYDDAAAEAQARRDREAVEVQAREREAKLAEEERAREAAEEVIRKANEEKRQAEDRTRQQAEAKREAEAARKAAEEAAKARETRVASEEQLRREAAAAAARKATEDAAKARVAAEEQARREAAAKQQQAAEPFRIYRYWQADDKCKPKPIARVAVVRAPKYGKVESRSETIIAENSRTGKCLGTKQNAIMLMYSPTTASATQDRLSIEVKYDNGTKTYDCLINVKDRKSDCQVL
jgi:serine/threonine protein kinase